MKNETNLDWVVDWPLRRLALGLLLCIVCAFGCSGRPKAAPVDTSKAREALKTTLDAWQAGATIESLASSSPAIVAQDFDWMQGKKLASYKIEGEGIPQDANLRVDVELTLKEGGATSSKRVAYIVGTDPALTVFRSFD